MTERCTVCMLFDTLGFIYWRSSSFDREQLQSSVGTLVGVKWRNHLLRLKVIRML
jgi:hypothetical protein